MYVTEIEGFYLAYWLNKFISSGIVNRHLICHNMDTFLTEQFTQPNPDRNWEH